MGDPRALPPVNVTQVFFAGIDGRRVLDATQCHGRERGSWSGGSDLVGGGAADRGHLQQMESAELPRPRPRTDQVRAIGRPPRFGSPVPSRGLEPQALSFIRNTIE